MDRSDRIIRNVASNWVGYAVNAAVTFFLTPLVLHGLGEARYGIWILTSSVIGYYGLLDLGFRAGVNQFLTRTLAVPDFKRASDVLSTSFVALSLLGIVMIGLSVAAAYLVPIWFDLPVNTRNEAFWCILIVGATAGAQCFLSPFSAVFIAKQRFDLSNLIGVSSRIAMAIATVLALKMGYGLIGVSLATAFGTVLDYAVRWLVARRLVPELSVSLSQSSMKRLGEIGAFGVWNFLISVSGYLYLHVQPLLIAAFMPIAAVGHYALAAGLWQQVNALIAPIGQVLYPAAAEMDVKGERRLLKQLYSDGTRLMLLVVIPVVLIACYWAEDFYRLWIGEEYVSGEPFASVATLFRIMMVATLFGYVSNVAGQILLGAGHIRPLALLKILGSATALTLSVLLIGEYALIGVATAVAISIIPMDVIGVPIALSRRVGLSMLEFRISVWIRLASVGLVLLPALYYVQRMTVADAWSILIVQGLVAGLCSAAAVIMIGLTAEERARFLSGPLKRLTAGRLTRNP